MMNYDLFKSLIAERIGDYLPPVFNEAEILVKKVCKINEEKDALIVVLKGDEMTYSSPTIYLDDMYEEFCEYEDLDDILFKISLIVMQYTGQIPRECIEIDLNAKRDSIVMTLINKEKNKSMLEDVPYKEFLDLAITYRIVMCFDDSGFSTVLLTNEIMEDMGLTLEEVDKLAQENTSRIFPLEICKFSKEFYMMTNEEKIHGATTMVCTESMEKLAEIINDNFYIIPSSIHEVLAVPAKYANLRRLKHILDDANENFVEPNEILSDRLYYYSLDERKVQNVASYK